MFSITDLRLGRLGTPRLCCADDGVRIERRLGPPREPLVGFRRRNRLDVALEWLALTCTIVGETVEPGVGGVLGEQPVARRQIALGQALVVGVDSMLGDDGVRLSGGQRQRVALARALLKDANFLVLDEATSDLDSNLERKVQRNIEAMERDYGIIAIAHRLSTVENADLIHTLERGRVTESGTHEDLVDNGGKYAELYDIQTG